MVFAIETSPEGGERRWVTLRPNGRPGTREEAATFPSAAEAAEVLQYLQAFDPLTGRKNAGAARIKAVPAGPGEEDIVLLRVRYTAGDRHVRFDREGTRTVRPWQATRFAGRRTAKAAQEQWSAACARRVEGQAPRTGDRKDTTPTESTESAAPVGEAHLEALLGRAAEAAKTGTLTLPEAREARELLERWIRQTEVQSGVINLQIHQMEATRRG